MAGRARCLHEFLLLEAQKGRAHQPRQPHPGEHADDQGNWDNAPLQKSQLGRADQRAEDNEHEELRKTEKRIGQAHKPGIEHPAEVARRRAQRGTDRQRHQRRGQPDGERDAPAVQRPREDVAARLVGAQGVGQ